MEDKVIMDTIQYLAGSIVGAYIFKSCGSSWPKFLTIQVVAGLLIILLRYYKVF